MNVNRWLAVAGLVSVLSLGGNLMAQERQGRPERGNFDPEQFRQRMMDRYREQLEIKGDDEWKAIQPRIEKVMEARRNVGFGGPGMGRMFGPQRGGRDNNEQGENRRPRFGGEPNPDVEALQKAVDAKASNEEIKSKLAKYRESRKEKEAALAKAQDDLRKVLTVRQEANAVLMGLLQ